MSEELLRSLFPFSALESAGQGHNLPERQVWQVSRLLSEINYLLDGAFHYIWIEGEVSNFKRASSGHIYFTLKDNYAQIRAVMFRSQAASSSSGIQDGQHVTCLARLNVYSGRGDLQLVLESIERKGEGALMLALEAVKARLAKEGLFSEGRKRPLPLIPERVFVITSPTGAAIQDFIRTARGRFKGARIIICPVKVQGEGASEEIIAALRMISKVVGDGDVIVLTRGGGSIEDLWAFNSEDLAWEISRAPVPVVSAVGHEIDFTIADLVADYRAATPTAAAQAIFPSQNVLLRRLEGLRQDLLRAALNRIRFEKKGVQMLAYRLKDPRHALRERQLRYDNLFGRLEGALNGYKRRCRVLSAQMEAISLRCVRAGGLYIERKRTALSGVVGRLEAASPLSILSRGYSIVYKGLGDEVVRDAEKVKAGERLVIIPRNGAILCEALSVAKDRYVFKKTDQANQV
ncbi:MAG: exodeoxyribonuclease VII large subunit [Dissulfurimicrobium hydrothermale]|uniref:exodeoxyribonuclease VII large subunit n=1 Tax=Dissulfurimicrobium hydrothermale TaxID=1750598 RepID=UPI003C777D74